jgi:heme/copper-type cytochrome/quinol oxidase subunit 3
MSSYRFPVPQAQVGRPSAWWGMTVLIASEATLFGTFIGT